MIRLKLDLENCYGIKKLVHEFDYSRHHSQLIYAANGMMKSSLALTLKGISGQCKDMAKDRLHPTLRAKFEVLVDGTQILKENVFVADPDEKSFDTSSVFTNFLADSALKAQYDTIFDQISNYIAQVINPLRDVSISSDCEDEILRTFTTGPTDNIFSIMEQLALDIQTQQYTNYGFRYNHVFDKGGKVQKFVEKHSRDLQDYINHYNRLLSTSQVFRSVNGKTFGTHQASELQKSIESGEFFGVDHHIRLHDGTEISTYDQLSSVFEAEKDRILNDTELKKTFDKITKAVDSNNEVRQFKEILMAHPEIVLELCDYEGFRKKTWKGYLSDSRVKQHLIDYYNYYKTQKEVLDNIIQQARAQLPLWKDIIRLYNDRFHVPFKVEIENHDEIILKQTAAKLKFVYIDDQNNPIEKRKEDIQAILSRGEQRAFYILQLLFELESRKSSGQDHLIVFDDIADSFDYQNKYAIIEYLHDLDDAARNIYMLVLTHNFDFYRTLASRLGLRSCSWMAVKKSDGTLDLKKGQFQKDLFSYFVAKHSDDKVFVSMIPFVRNLVEYTNGDTDPDYSLLTSCLHLKADTLTITDQDVISVVKKFVKGSSYARIPVNEPIYNVITRTADGILSEANVDEVLIENKIVLSIACRLKAEKYLERRLLAAGLTTANLVVTSVQTAEWTKLLKLHCPKDPNKSVIEQVNMMTPEIIHINSFMYEPLIDLSLYHLMDLYRKCSAL